MALLTAKIDPQVFLEDIKGSDQALIDAQASYSRLTPSRATLTLFGLSEEGELQEYLVTVLGSSLPASLESPGVAALFASISQLSVARVDTPSDVLFSWDSQGNAVTFPSLGVALEAGDVIGIIGLFLRGVDTLSADYEVVNIDSFPQLENVNLLSMGRDVIANQAANLIRGNQFANHILCGDGDDEARGFDGNDTIEGGAGADRLFGAQFNDLLLGDGDDDAARGGNGRDTLIGGSGRDELWGDFGRNAFMANDDGESDLLVIKSDQIMFNPLLGRVDDSGGLKSDLIGEIDAVDRIVIQGVQTEELGFQADYSWVDLNESKAVFTGIAILAAGKLEALYVGSSLSLDQIQAITTGDASEASLNNTLEFYGTW